MKGDQLLTEEGDLFDKDLLGDGFSISEKKCLSVFKGVVTERGMRLGDGKLAKIGELLVGGVPTKTIQYILDTGDRRVTVLRKCLRSLGFEVNCKCGLPHGHTEYCEYRQTPINGTKVCSECGEDFYFRRKHEKVCSDNCRKKVRYRRKYGWYKRKIVEPEFKKRIMDSKYKLRDLERKAKGGKKCHLCGLYYLRAGTHAYHSHGISKEEYEKTKEENS